MNGQSAGAAFNAMIQVLEPPVRRWWCPACKFEHTTKTAKPHTPMHTCAKAAGMTVPLLPLGTKGKVELHEREDYVGAEDVQYDENGRAIQSVITTRDEGQDTTVYAPTALMSSRD